MAPKDVHVLIPRACRSVRFCGKGELRLQMKFKMSREATLDYPARSKIVILKSLQMELGDGSRGQRVSQKEASPGKKGTKTWSQPSGLVGKGRGQEPRRTSSLHAAEGAGDRPRWSPQTQTCPRQDLNPGDTCIRLCPPELSEKKSAREQDTPFVATSWGGSSKRMKYARTPRPKAFYLGSKAVHFQSLNCLRS